jgi:hypothetical protein
MVTAAQAVRNGAAERAIVEKSASSVRRTLRGESGVQLTGLVQPPELGVAADRRPVDQDLRHRPAAGQVEEMTAEVRIVVEEDLVVGNPLPFQERLRPDAVAAGGVPSSG